jgi:carboxyl-terminal processing protease
MMTMKCLLYSLVIVLVYFSRCDGFAAPKPTRRSADPLMTQPNHDEPLERQSCRWQTNTLSSLVGAFLWTASLVLFPFQLDLYQQVISPGPPIIQLQRPAASALTNEQQLVADVWKEVTRQYIDTSYNGLGEDGWRQKRLDAVKKVTDIGPPDTPQKQEQIYATIRTMLSALNDPYTRFLTPEQYESLTVYAKGSNVGGIGVSLIVDNGGRIVVAQVTPGSPAEKGGVEAGDVIVEIDGVDIAYNGATAEYVAAKCRGEAGSNLNLAVQRPNKKVTNLTLTRAKIKNNPVQVSTITVDNKKVGLLKVTAFSQETVSQIVDALRDISKERISALAIDLRGNVGGYMPAGVDVAKLFLPPNVRIVSEVDKSGRATIYVADGVGSETEKPLYLLVDKRTASASEILASALQDNNHRATVIGSTATFGKGRIQNVQALEDGSGISVTKAKYITPSGRDIQGKGVTPDRITEACGPDESPVACLTGLII